MKFFFSRKIFALKVVVLLLFTNNSNSQTTYKVIYKVEPILQEKIDDKLEKKLMRSMHFLKNKSKC